MSLNSELVQDNIFAETYHQTLIEIHNIQYFPFYQQIVTFFQKGINFVESIIFLKFLTASFIGILFIVYGVLELYIKKQNAQDILLGAIMFTIITGIIGVLVPIIFSPIVNYILYVIVQVLLLLLLSKLSNSQTNEQQLIE